MKNVQVRNVPEDVHQVLRERAAKEGMSLQEYLLARLTSEARHPTIAEVLERAGQRSGGELPLMTALELLHDEREAR